MDVKYQNNCCPSCSVIGPSQRIRFICSNCVNSRCNTSVRVASNNAFNASIIKTFYTSKQKLFDLVMKRDALLEKNKLLRQETERIASVNKLLMSEHAYASTHSNNECISTTNQPQKEHLNNLTLQLKQRKREVIKQLVSAFRLKQINKSECMISGVTLKNTVIGHTLQSPEHIAAAIGQISFFVQLLAKYLGIHTPHDIVFCSTESFIIDNSVPAVRARTVPAVPQVPQQTTVAVPQSKTNFFNNIFNIFKNIENKPKKKEVCTTQKNYPLYIVNSSGGGIKNFLHAIDLLSTNIQIIANAVNIKIYPSSSHKLLPNLLILCSKIINS